MRAKRHTILTGHIANHDASDQSCPPQPFRVRHNAAAPGQGVSVYVGGREVFIELEGGALVVRGFGAGAEEHSAEFRLPPV